MTSRLLTIMIVLAPARALSEEYDIGAIEARKPREVTVPPKQGEPFFEAGRRVFFQRCAPCHGPRGAGDGPAADYLDPRPRDFTTGQFRFRTTRSGELPTDADLFRTVSRGVPGTAMPAWGEGVFRLPELERWQAAYFVKHLGRDFWNPEFDPYGKTSDGKPRVVKIPELLPVTAERIERGKTLYLDETKGACVKCHGQLGRGDGKETSNLKDDRGDLVLPADQTRPWRYKNGSSVGDIFRTFTTGLNGTPMPGFDKTIPSEEDRFALAMYVASLQERPGETDKPLLVRRKEGALPDDPDAPAWRQANSLWVWLAGQVIVGPRWANPSVDLVEVRALHDGREIAFLFSWNDRFKNDHGPTEEPSGDLWRPKDSYVPAAVMRQRAQTVPLPDQLAIQFPVGKPVAGRVEKPYFLMGDPGHRVNVWQWRADHERAIESNAAGAERGYVAQGPADQALRARVKFDRGRWKLVLRRSLGTANARLDVQLAGDALVPFALRAWDGAAGEWGIQSSVSSWRYLKLETPTTPVAYLFAFVAMGLVAGLEAAAVRRLRRSGGG